MWYELAWFVGGAIATIIVVIIDDIYYDVRVVSRARGGDSSSDNEDTWTAKAE
jgi:hypothetical protein